MAEEKTKKIVLEREYIVPLRSEWLKVPKYKRANKAVKALKEFMVKHMKVYDRDLRKIKVDIYLNNELRFRGMRKPLAKVKVKAIKYEDGTVIVKLVQLPKHIEFEIARNVKRQAEGLKKKAESEKSAEIKAPETKEENSEKQKDIKEKEESSKLAEEKIDKDLAKQAKHTSGVKKEPELKRKMMKR